MGCDAIRPYPSRSSGIQTPKPVFMTNSTLGKKYPRTRRPVTIDLQPGPRELSIRLILGYSRALKVVDVPPVGEIALVLN